MSESHPTGQAESRGRGSDARVRLRSLPGARWNLAWSLLFAPVAVAQESQQMRPVLEVLVEFFGGAMAFGLTAIGHPYAPWIASGAIVVLAAYAGWDFSRRQLRPLVRGLNAAATAVERVGQGNFFDEYEELSESLDRNPVVRHAWKGFSETLLVDVEMHHLKSTVHAADYFTLEAIADSGRSVNLRLYQSLPNMFLGIGLFCTFLGLVAALYGASGAIDGGNVARAQAALGDLLNAATFKFATSLAGLSASLVLTWWEKTELHRLRRALSVFVRSLDERLSRVTPEAVAHEQLGVLRSQTAQLERFNTDLATQIAQAFDQTLQRSLTQAIEPLAQTMESLRESTDRVLDRMGTVSEDAIGRLLTEFTERMHGAAGRELDRMAESLLEASEEIRRVQKDLVASGAGLGQAVEESARAAGERLRADGQAFGEALQESVSALSSVVSAFEVSVGNLETVSRAVQERAEAGSKVFHDGLRSAKESLDALQGVTSAASQVLEPIREAASALTSAADMLEKSTKSGSELTGRVNQLSQQLTSTVGTMETTWKEQSVRFGQLDASLSAVFRELASGLEGFRKAVEGTVRGVDQQFAGSIRLLSGAIGELREVVEDLNPPSEAEPTTDGRA